MILKDECFYYLARIFKKKTLQLKRQKEWYIQLQKHKCIFVHIPKTAGVSISVSLFGKGIANTPALYYNVLLGKEDFNNYFKFSFVRNPFTRLVSAYEFLQKESSPYDEKLVSVVRSYNSFESFVINYLDGNINEIKNYFRPKHYFFKPQYYFLCNSKGEIMVDYVGYFESIEEDYEHIRAKIGTGQPLKKMNVTKSKKLSIEEYYSNDKIINKVISVYEKDFELFGYPKDISSLLPVKPASLSGFK
jgi:hypothetical protein